MQKIMSMILSLTMILSLVTPVSATEMSEGYSENEQTIKLEDIVDTNAVELESDTEVSDMKDYGQAMESFEDEVIESSEDIDTSINDIENNSEESFDKEEQDIELPSYTIDDEMESYLEEYLNSLKKEEEYLDSETEQSLEEYLNSLISDEDLAESEENLEDGIYTADFSAYKTGTESSSSMAKYIDSEKSRIKVKNGKITVQLVINDSKTVVSTDASVNGEKVNTKRIDIDDASYIAEFKLESIEDKINLTVDCDYSTIIPGMGVKTHDFDLLISDITYLEDLPEELPDESQEVLGDGIYSADFSAYKTGTESSSSMAKYIDNEKSRIKIKNGNITVQLVINDSNMVISIDATVNGEAVNTKRTDIDDTSYKVEFKLNSIEDKISITAGCNYSAIVPGMGVKTHDFDLVISDIMYLEDLPEDLEDGIYTADFSAYKTGTESSSSMAKYIDNEKSRIKVKNGNITVQLVINDSKTVISADASVNGQKVYTKRTDIDDTSYIAEFKLDSIGDKINLTVDCDYSTIIPGMGVKTHDFDLVISDITYLEDLSEEEEKLKDGKYSIDFTSNGTRHIKTSYLEVENGKMNVVITFSSGSSIEITNVKVNDNLIDNYYLSEVVNDALTIKIPVDSLEDKINILMTIRVPSINMVHNYDISVENISIIGDYTEVGDDSSEDAGDEPEDNIPEEDNKTLADGTYSIESVFLKANSTSTSAASSYFDSKSTLKVKDGKYTLILNVNQYITAFSNLSAIIDGVITKDVNLIKNSDGTGTISFSINSLSSSISVGCTLTVTEINYVNTTEFTVKLDASTLKNENGESVEAPEEDKLPLNVDAIYTINNRVIAGENGTIPESARYLDASSFVEVKYGNIFATLVFNSSDFMDGRSITLNNNSSATPVSKSIKDNKTYVSFMISSLSDEIHVSSKSTKNIDDSFTIVFDSSTLVRDTNSSNTNNGDDNSTSATEKEDDDDDLEDGTYTIKNKVLKEDSDSESHAREYVDKESVITVKNGKIYVTLKFKKASLIKDVSIKVEGKRTSYTTEKKTSDKRYIKFKIGSLSDEILVTTDLDLGNFGIANHDGLAFRVLLRSSTLEEDDDADDYDNEDDDDETSDKETVVDQVIDTIVDDELQFGSINTSEVSTDVKHKKVTYKVNNEIITDSAFGYQAARGAVNEVSYYEIVDDKKYITLGFSQTDIMNNIRLSMNGQKINYDVISKDDSKNTLQIRFEVPSISAQLTVTTNVTAMGRDISFGVQFIESTLELISTEEYEELPALAEHSSDSTASSSSGNLISKITNAFSSKNSNEGGIVVDEEAAENLSSLAKEYFKKYTVSNDVISDSAIGRSMARKYLNQTSIIEDIDGQLYATITFSSASSMGDFRIEVNGETVSHTVPLNDMSNDLISLRFPINNVNDDIRAYMYINPMRMTINFGIKFLEDSMILIEEGTVGEEGDTESSSLVDTLSDINGNSQNGKEQVSVVKIAASTSVIMLILNQLTAGLGGLFKRIKVKSILGKITNKE